MRFVKGDYVVYDQGHGKPRVGRVTADRGDLVWACYSSGCTAEAAPRTAIRIATNVEVNRAPKDLGHNRFSKFCASYDEGSCWMYCPEKG